VSKTDKISTLRADGLRKVYKRRVVVQGSTLEVRQGECVGLLGPNGAGKTTTFYMITGMVPPEDGKVFLDGQDITRRAMYKRVRLGLAYLPQEPSIFRRMSVEDNIMSILQLQPITSTPIEKNDWKNCSATFGFHTYEKARVICFQGASGGAVK